MADWTPQPDGTMLPSQELIDHVRNNPNLYPNAVQDFSKITGKSPDEVQAIFDNTGHTFGTGYAREFAKGAVEGAANAADNLIPSSTLGDGANEMRSFAESLDPKFDTQKGVVDNLVEGAGQYAPAVAAAVLTDGAAAGLLAGAGTSTLLSDTHKANDMVGLIKQVAPGAPVDFMMPKDGDSEAVATVKSVARNVVSDALFMGAGEVAASAIKGLWKAIAPGASKEATAAGEEALSKAAAEVTPETQAVNPEESAVTPEAQQVLDKDGVKQLADAATEVRGLKQDQLPSTDEYNQFVQNREYTNMRSRMAGQEPPASADNVAMRSKFVDNVTAIADRMENRSEIMSGGLKPSDAIAAKSVQFIHKMYDAIQTGNDEDLFKVASDGVKSAGNTLDNSYAHAITAAAIHQANYEKGQAFEAMLQVIRENRANGIDVSVNAASQQTAKNLFSSLLNLRNLDYHLGSTSSYIMNYRKGLLKGDGDYLERALNSIQEGFDKEGVSLFDDRIEFSMKYKDQLEGIDANYVKVAEMVDEMFNQFDKERQGTLDNIRSNTLAKMSAEEKAKAAGSFFGMVKGYQKIALLGQLGTTGVNAIGEGLNALLLPALENGLGKGDFSRMTSEYAGMLAGTSRAWKIAKQVFSEGNSTVEGHFVREGSFADLTSYANVPFSEKPYQHLALRLLKGALDLAMTLTDFWKALNIQGTAYADGLEMGMQQGMGRVEAKAFARDFMSKQLNEQGTVVNANYLLKTRGRFWDASLDTRYAVGKMSQAVDNLRNRNDALGLLASLAVPFYRKLLNISSSAVQSIVPPGMPSALRYLAKQEDHAWLQQFPKVFKTLDDFTGANGVDAMNRALGMQRLGMGVMAAGYAAIKLSDHVDISGSSGVKRWDAKKRAFQEYPPNSLIVGDTSYSLDKFLPFSAPLMVLGNLRDLEKEASLQMRGGNYVADGGAASDFAKYAPALLITTLTMFQDAPAAQGVFGLFDALKKASEGDPSGIERYLETYPQQLTPGAAKVVAKNINTTQYEGYDFFTRFGAAMGLPVGSPKLDFAGDPITYDLGRGIDPSNSRHLKLDDPIHREFANLNQTEGLALVPPDPDKVLDKSFWAKMGVGGGGLLAPSKPPSLTEMQTTDGKNGWEAYRELLYKGKVSQDTLVSASGGDGIALGHVELHQGEDFKETMGRVIQSHAYQNLTPDAKTGVWKSVFSFYQNQAKQALEAKLVVSPQTFDNGRYANPIREPSALGDMMKAAQMGAAQTQTTKGDPLDAAFSIK